MQATESLFTWQHGVIVVTLLTPFIVFWLDARGQSNRHHRETMDQQHTQHTENMERFKAIETKIDPLWTWWNRVRADERERKMG